MDVPEQTSSVPEPGTLTLVALGAAALFRRRPRR
ncbi:MAG: PEP-CTERM sorting domain-containing protein [Steroidobacteraceae bacterium]